MSDGVEHAKASVIVAAGIIPSGWLMTADWGLAFVAAAGCLSGVILSPDLDQAGRTNSETLVYNKLGCLIGTIFYLYWLPYAKLFKHRSRWTHLPVVGTLGRVLYLLFPWWCVLFFLGFREEFLMVFENYYFAAWLLGLMMSDFAHWLMDGMKVY